MAAGTGPAASGADWSLSPTHPSGDTRGAISVAFPLLGDEVLVAVGGMAVGVEAGPAETVAAGLRCAVEQVGRRVAGRQLTAASFGAEVFSELGDAGRWNLSVAHFDPPTGRVLLATTGGTLCWVRQGGRFVASGLRSQLPPVAIGSSGGCHWLVAHLQLQPGDVVLLLGEEVVGAAMADGARFDDGALERLLGRLPPTLSSREVVMQLDAHLRRVAASAPRDLVMGVLSHGTQVSAPPRGHSGRGRRVLRMPPTTPSAAEARAFAAEACRTWGVPSGTASDVQLIASELVTNAILHARTEVELSVVLRRDVLRVEVHDDDPVLPRLPVANAVTADASAIAEHGRGLLLATRLASQMGAEPAGAGKTLWAEVMLGRP